MSTVDIFYILDIFPKISETFILNEILELEKKGFRVHVLSLRAPTEIIQHEHVAHLKLAPLYFNEHHEKTLFKLFQLFNFCRKSPVTYLSGLFELLKYDRELRWNFHRMIPFARLVEKYNISHIHAHFAGQAAESAMCLSLLTKVPFSFTNHGYDVYYNPHRFYKLLVQRSKYTITVSDYNSRYLMETFDVDGDKLKVVRCGIQTDKWQPDPLVLKDIDVITVARLHPVKGLNFLLSACLDIAKLDTGFKCVIVGEGDERAKLQEFITEHHLENNVVLVGAKNQDQVRFYLSRSRIFVLSSVSEAMPVSLMEAMSCEIPVVATNVRGVSELVEHGVNGLLIEPEMPEQIVKSILMLLSDGNLRESFGKNGRVKVSRYFNSLTEIAKIEQLILG